MRLVRFFALASLAVAGVLSASPAQAALSPMPYYEHITVDTNLASLHTAAWAREQLNQWNFGAGVTLPYPWDAENLAATAGEYKNSFDRTSFYAGVLYTPIHWQGVGLHWRAGAIGGIVTGYHKDENPDRPLLAAFTLSAQTNGGAGVRLFFCPAGFSNPAGSGSSGTTGAVALQVLIPWD